MLMTFYLNKNSHFLAVVFIHQSVNQSIT